MTKSEAIAYYSGNVSALARALDIDQSTVYSWADFPPYPRQCQLELVTRGDLKATKPAKREKSNEKAGA